MSSFFSLWLALVLIWKEIGNYLWPLWSFRHNYHRHVLREPHHEILTWSSTLFVVAVFLTHHDAALAAILVAERVGDKYHAKVWLWKLWANAFSRGTYARVACMRDTVALFDFSIAYTPKRAWQGVSVSSWNICSSTRKLTALLLIMLPRVLRGSFHGGWKRT